MGDHVFVFINEDEVNHNFSCEKCGLNLGFNKPEIGAPNADLSGPVPVVTPQLADIYVPPCEV